MISVSFEEFCKQMSAVEKKEEFVFGRESDGNSRAVFEFAGHACYLESFGYRRIPESRKRTGRVTPAEMMWVISAEPKDWWVLADWVKGKHNATVLAKNTEVFPVPTSIMKMTWMRGICASKIWRKASSSCCE